MFVGEDSTNAQRLRKQKNQVQDFLLQQINEKHKQNLQTNQIDEDINCAVLHRENLVQKLMCRDYENRRNVCRMYNECNKTMALQKQESGMLQKIKEEAANQKDINVNFYGDLLSENPSVARNTMYPHRVLPIRWKGMSKMQLDSVYKTQREQIQQNQKNKEKEKHELNKWNEYVIHNQQTSRCLDRKINYERQQFLKHLEAENKQLALRQKEEKIQLYKNVYSNIPTEAYFCQFNTSSR